MTTKIINCKHKVKYISENHAMIDIERIQKKSNRDKVPIRAYLCECGSWHLTSKIKHSDIVISELRQEIIKLNQNISNLKAENELLKNYNASKQEHDIAVDERIKKINQRLFEKNQVIKYIRNDNKDLICKILQLENRINDLQKM